MTGTDSTGKRVFVVDDDPVSLLMLRHILEVNGCEVVEATGVAEASELLAQSNDVRFDVIVSDYLMPDGTGLDLLEVAARRRGHSHTPFVLLTGVATIDELHDHRVASVAAFVTKPVSSSELMDVIRGFDDEESFAA